MIKTVIKMARVQLKQIEITNLIKIANKLTLGMARTNLKKKEVLASTPTWLPHLPGKFNCLACAPNVGIFN
jgi:hypothetical protein